MFRTTHPLAHETIEHREALRRAEHLRALESPQGASGPEADITVRPLHPDDAVPLARLAERDSSGVPPGPLLGAEVAGVLVAAISLRDGTVLADPFSPTSAPIELLRLRASQLGGERRRRLPRLPRIPRRARACGSLAGSPPGAGGRLLRL